MSATTSRPTVPVPEGPEWPTISAAFGQWTPQAVIFDWDGLLMNTESSWSFAKRRLFERRCLAMRPEHVEMTYGLYPGHSAKVLAPFLNEQPSVLAEELVHFALQNVNKGVNPMAGAHTVLELASQCVKIAVASNSPRAVLDAGLDQAGWNATLTTTVAADEVEAPKPHPYIYDAARRALEAEVQDTLVFEDSTTGITAARSAGLKVIAISARNSLPLVKDGYTLGAHVQFSSFTDPQLQAWLKSWS
ncbi:HAD family phosphatase [Paenarthrobacter ilicis]|uniref:HAD family hydrolase n=1 Tax=Paenarthrobacter ilicis TaxID=43665 RepID=UPI0028D36028|nr:HAD family phosphatase [Paenarthrobacter ilicis]